MIKFTSNNDFNFDIQSVSLITDDKTLTKRASAKHLLKYAKTPNQEDLHIIALGAYEGTGYNRNLDCFMEKDCEANYHYFTDSDRAVHRHHKNKPTDPKFGNIKAAAYNKAMKRIELVVGLDKDKCADILDEQERTGNTNWSMASKQAYDVCSWCGHKAKTDKDRCEHIPSKLGDLDKIGQICGMINPDPKWFEISHVRRPADRIGMSLGKLAADSTLRPMLPSDYLNVYGNIYVPPTLELSKKASDKRQLSKKLAEMEKHIEAMAPGAPSDSCGQFFAQHGHKIHRGQRLSPQTIDELRKFDPDKLMKVLADNGIILRPEEFSNYLFGDRVQDKSIQGMKSHLPDIYSGLDKDDDTEVVNNEKYEPSSSAVISPELKQLVHKLAPAHSLSGQSSLQRVMNIMTMLKGSGQDVPLRTAQHEKTKEAFDKELAKQYAAYKLAALNYLDENNKLDDNLIWNSLVQNRT